MNPTQYQLTLTTPERGEACLEIESDDSAYLYQFQIASDDYGSLERLLNLCIKYYCPTTLTVSADFQTNYNFDWTLIFSGGQVMICDHKIKNTLWLQSVHPNQLIQVIRDSVAAHIHDWVTFTRDNPRGYFMEEYTDMKQYDSMTYARIRKYLNKIQKHLDSTVQAPICP